MLVMPRPSSLGALLNCIVTDWKASREDLPQSGVTDGQKATLLHGESDLDTFKETAWLWGGRWKWAAKRGRLIPDLLRVLYKARGRALTSNAINRQIPGRSKVDVTNRESWGKILSNQGPALTEDQDHLILHTKSKKTYRLKI